MGRTTMMRRRWPSLIRCRLWRTPGRSGWWPRASLAAFPADTPTCPTPGTCNRIDLRKSIRLHVPGVGQVGVSAGNAANDALGHQPDRPGVRQSLHRIKLGQRRRIIVVRPIESDLHAYRRMSRSRKTNKKRLQIAALLDAGGSRAECGKVIRL